MGFDIKGIPDTNPDTIFDTHTYDWVFKDLGVDNPFGDIKDIYDSWSDEFNLFLGDIKDLQEKMEKYGKWFETYQKHISKGDGNAAVDDIIKGYKDGILTKEEAIAMAQQVQEQANLHGGGRINNEKRNALKTALGVDTDYISKGKTRGQLGWESFTNGFMDFFSNL